MYRTAVSEDLTKAMLRKRVTSAKHYEQGTNCRRKKMEVE